MSIVQPCRVPAGAAAGGGGLRIPSPGRAAAWRRRPATRHAKAGEWPQASPFACPQGALPLLPWALPPAPQLPRLLPPSTATPTLCLGCICRPELFPTDHLSFLSIPSPLAASMPWASRTLLLLLSCPPPLVREFFGPRDPVFSWMQGKHRVLGTVGGSHPAPARYQKKTTKSEKTQPTTCLSNAPRFLYIDCVI